jgi:hypothetical protein
MRSRGAGVEAAPSAGRVAPHVVRADDRVRLTAKDGVDAGLVGCELLNARDTLLRPFHLAHQACGRVSDFGSFPERLPDVREHPRADERAARQIRLRPGANVQLTGIRGPGGIGPQPEAFRKCVRALGEVHDAVPQGQPFLDERREYRIRGIGPFEQGADVPMLGEHLRSQVGLALVDLHFRLSLRSDVPVDKSVYH